MYYFINISNNSFTFFYRYDAVIDAITDDGLVAITFDGFGNSDVTKLSALKDRIPGEKRGLHRPGFGDSDKNKYVNQPAAEFW